MQIPFKWQLSISTYHSPLHIGTQLCVCGAGLTRELLRHFARYHRKHIQISFIINRTLKNDLQLCNYHRGCWWYSTVRCWSNWSHSGDQFRGLSWRFKDNLQFYLVFSLWLFSDEVRYKYVCKNTQMAVIMKYHTRLYASTKSEFQFWLILIDMKYGVHY